ncbi:MAG TPA: hypothetical protein VM716_00060 [Gemmatimonadales bacterium]|nr:hypothetical protein [Gemmatimonadales bacterium]
MRILMGVLALVALPFLASVAQQSDQGNQDSQQCESDGNDGTECNGETPLPPPPPPPSTCGPTVSAPTATISGSVTNIGVGLSGVCVQVFLGTTLTAGTLTDATGSYSLGVSAPSTGATFLVCLVVPTGSIQSSPLVTSGFPACPSGAAGFSPFLLPGGSALFVSFTL